jgi:hypothetical protein
VQIKSNHKLIPDSDDDEKASMALAALYMLGILSHWPEAKRGRGRMDPKAKIMKGCFV